MTFLDIAGWAAPAATMAAAVMTAANLGARVTGWGFMVFTLGSIFWVIVGLQNDQIGLVITNVVLALINAVGVWRWLGREARYEAVGKAVEAAPAAELPTRGLAGREIIDGHGRSAGHAVDAIVDCHTARIHRIILRTGGISGVGERLVSIDMAQLTLGSKVIRTTLSAAAIAVLPAVE